MEDVPDGFVLEPQELTCVPSKAPRVISVDAQLLTTNGLEQQYLPQEDSLIGAGPQPGNLFSTPGIGWVHESGGSIYIAAGWFDVLQPTLSLLGLEYELDEQEELVAFNYGTEAESFAFQILTSERELRCKLAAGSADCRETSDEDDLLNRIVGEKGAEQLKFDFSLVLNTTGSEPSSAEAVLLALWPIDDSLFLTLNKSQSVGENDPMVSPILFLSETPLPSGLESFFPGVEQVGGNLSSARMTPGVTAASQGFPYVLHLSQASGELKAVSRKINDDQSRYEPDQTWEVPEHVRIEGASFAFVSHQVVRMVETSSSDGRLGTFDGEVSTSRRGYVAISEKDKLVLGPANGFQEEGESFQYADLQLQDVSKLASGVGIEMTDGEVPPVVALSRDDILSVMTWDLERDLRLMDVPAKGIVQDLVVPDFFSRETLVLFKAVEEGTANLGVVRINDVLNLEGSICR